MWLLNLPTDSLSDEEIARIRNDPYNALLLLYRPETRGECQGMPGFCPYVTCKWHLGLDVDPDSKEVRINFPSGNELDIDGMIDSCALDVADRGDATLEEVAKVMGVSAMAVYKIQQKALNKLKVALEAAEIFSDGS